MADRDVEGLLRWSLACMALASAVIHASAAADHQGFPLHVAFFLVVAAVQSALAAAASTSTAGRSRPSPTTTGPPILRPTITAAAMTSSRRRTGSAPDTTARAWPTRAARAVIPIRQA